MADLKIEFGIQSRRRISPHIETIIRGWAYAMKRYDNFLGVREKDLSYVYGERATISLFAAGAWLRGYAAIEEFKSTKIKSRQEKYGRVDLYIFNKKNNVEVEAKYLEINASPQADGSAKIRRVLNSAAQSAESYRRILVTCGIRRQLFETAI
jgi:hypothetical protein